MKECWDCYYSEADCVSDKWICKKKKRKVEGDAPACSSFVTEEAKSCLDCTYSEAVVGDECITFDRVTVVEDGKAIIDIDHKESTKGTCKASWVQIREKLSEEGLFLEDITKNGKSIFEPSSKSESASVPAEGVRSNQ